MESKYSVVYEGTEVKVALEGRLDAANAPGLADELKKLVGKKISRILFDSKNLEYISSAGVRVIIFAKQKLGLESEVFFSGASAEIANVIKMSGLDNYIKLL